MIPKPDLKLFLGAFLLSVILFSNAYECCSGGGEEKETTEAPVIIGMIFKHIKSFESQFIITRFDCIITQNFIL